MLITNNPFLSYTIFCLLGSLTYGLDTNNPQISLNATVIPKQFLSNTSAAVVTVATPALPDSPVTPKLIPIVDKSAKVPVPVPSTVKPDPDDKPTSTPVPKPTSEVPPSNGSSTVAPDKNVTTSIPSSTSSIIPNISTTTHLPSTAPPTPHQRQFDGPSFIGGIILTTGLMAISFVAFKFYKARTERNYHTL